MQRIRVRILNERDGGTVPGGTAYVVEKLNEIEGISVQVYYYEYAVAQSVLAPDGTILVAGA